jgi:hypothetical protein
MWLLSCVQTLLFPRCCYHAAMLRRVGSVLLLLLLAILAVGGTRQIYRKAGQSIVFAPLPLVHKGEPPANVGALAFLGAWEMKSDNMDFGGFSALTALRDGRLLAVSDAGILVGFAPPGSNITGRNFIAPLPGAFGDDVSFRDRDSEALAYDRETGRVWISYEGNPAIRRMLPSFARIDGVARPAAIRAWKGNSGGEAMARLADGRFLLFSEGRDRADGSYDAIQFSGDPVDVATRAFRFGYRPPSGYKPTDAVQLPGGRLLILNRHIGFPDGFSAKLVTLDPDAIGEGKAVKGRVIATLASPLLVDNMEGLALTEEHGRTIIWLISDNNFNIFQRTLLMKFALQGPKKKPEAAIPAPGFDSL